MQRINGATLLFAVALAGVASCASSADPFSLPAPRPAAAAPAEDPAPDLSPGMVEVPDLRYLAVDFARIDLEEIGLKLAVIEKKETIDFEPETILKQNPKAGALVQSGTEIDVTISRLPKCNPSYPTLCLPSRGPDLDCEDISANHFKVLPPDPYKLDSNGDGIGCTNKK